MRELTHAFLFKPPPGTDCVVIPVLGRVVEEPTLWRTPMDQGYAKLAKGFWPYLDINLGVLQKQRGALPQPLTLEKDGRRWVPGRAGKHKPLALRYHLVSFPTRPYDETPITAEYIGNQARALALLFDGRLPHLKDTKQVVLPQLCDAHKTWEQVRPYVEPYLDDRFVVITGKPGTIT